MPPVVCRYVCMYVYTDLFESLVHTAYRYPVSACMIIIIRIPTHTYSIIAKSSVSIDCELEILYSNTAHVYVYNTMILTLLPVPGVDNQPKRSV